MACAWYYLGTMSEDRDFIKIIRNCWIRMVVACNFAVEVFCHSRSSAYNYNYKHRTTLDTKHCSEELEFGRHWNEGLESKSRKTCGESKFSTCQDGWISIAEKADRSNLYLYTTSLHWMRLGRVKWPKLTALAAHCLQVLPAWLRRHGD